MKILVAYEYPPPPAGLATQGDLLYQGLLETGIEAHPVNLTSAEEKEWYYRWFRPDVVLGVGYWGYTPDLVLHPQRHGMRPVPWLVADGFIANYQESLNALPLILVTSNWVKSVYVRDGIRPDTMEVLPVGCNTDLFSPHARDDPRIAAVREELGIAPDELMILTVGGDAASKGAQEVMRALASIDGQVPRWRYVCKVWPQKRTEAQNVADLELVAQLGIEKKVMYLTHTTSHNFMPYLIGACDIYAAPSHLEGFGMPQVEAGACQKPVIGIKAMGMLDTLVHGETAFLASVAREIVVGEETLGPESGFEAGHRVVFEAPRTVGFRAAVEEIATYLKDLMTNSALRERMGKAARSHVVQHFDYRIVARQFSAIIRSRLGIN